MVSMFYFRPRKIGFQNIIMNQHFIIKINCISHGFSVDHNAVLFHISFSIHQYDPDEYEVNCRVKIANILLETKYCHFWSYSNIH